MEWYQKVVWYAVLGFAVVKTGELVGLIRSKVDPDDEERTVVLVM